MNYTGRPSISGCRPVLSLYPTHCFCQYLLRIFITFTNSSLFTRAFSTNSRRALRQRLSLWERSSTSPSRLRRATARAQPLRHACGVPPPLPRGGFGIAENFSSSPEAPLLGELSSQARLRGCTKGSLSSVGKSGSWHLLYLFGELYVIMVLRPCPPILWEGR